MAAALRFRWNVLVVLLCCAVKPDYLYFAIVYLMIGILSRASFELSRVSIGRKSLRDRWNPGVKAGQLVKSKQRVADLAICHFISIFFLFTEVTVVLFIRSHLPKFFPDVPVVPSSAFHLQSVSLNSVLTSCSLASERSALL